MSEPADGRDCQNVGPGITRPSQRKTCNDNTSRANQSCKATGGFSERAAQGGVVLSRVIIHCVARWRVGTQAAWPSQ